MVILGLLTVMVISAIVFIAWEPFSQIVIVLMQQADAALAALTGPNPVLRWAGGFVFTVLVWAICVALLWLEVRRPRARTIVVQQVSGGQAELTADSIISRLEYNLDQLPDVIRARPRVHTARKGVRIDLAVETSPEVAVPSKSEEIQQVTRDIIENQMGLKLESMRVVMRHAPYPKSFFKGHKPETGVTPRPAVRPQLPKLPQPAPLPAVAAPRAIEEPVPAPARHTPPAVVPIQQPEPVEPAPPLALAPEPTPETTLAPAASATAGSTDRTPWRPWSLLRPNSPSGSAAAAVTVNIPPAEELPTATEAAEDVKSSETSTDDQKSDEGKGLFS
jgi:hypothetical protein